MLELQILHSDGDAEFDNMTGTKKVKVQRTFMLPAHCGLLMLRQALVRLIQIDLPHYLKVISTPAES